MRVLMAGAVLALAAFGTAAAQGSHYVNGYYRSNGTYVAPHYQTNPDGNVYNNWSTQGNVNPYTGQPGYRSPQATYGYSAPTYVAPAYTAPTFGYQPAPQGGIVPYSGYRAPAPVCQTYPCF